MVTCGHSWWVALPDCQGAVDLAELLRPHAADVVSHASGRVWLLGRWVADEVAVAEAGLVRVVVAGFCPATTTRLQRLADQVRGLGDLDRLDAELTGSFHTLASLAGKTRIQGSISGLRRVFHTRIGGVTVASDRADILAEFASATLDERWLAMRMLYPPMAHMFSEASPWSGVKGLGSDCCLLTDAFGTSRAVRWWNPPEPTLPLIEGAAVLRQALSSAVEARTSVGGVISCDLSGGLDSTSLCFLAARGDTHLLTVNFDGLDPGNEDRLWAERAARDLTGMGDVQCLFLGREDVPLMYARVQEAGEGVDVPTPHGGVWW